MHDSGDYRPLINTTFPRANSNATFVSAFPTSIEPLSTTSLQLQATVVLDINLRPINNPHIQVMTRYRRALVNSGVLCTTIVTLL